MENEIKVGDKVRVSKDAPKLYTRWYECDFLHCDSTVKCVESDSAEIERSVGDNGNLYYLTIPLEYLIKVEEEKNVKIGDKVVVHYPSGDRIGRIQEVMLDGTYDIDYGGGCTGHNITRSQIEPYTAPEIKTGDRVRNIESGLIGVVDKIVHGNIAWVNCVDGKRYHWKSDELELIEPTEQTEAEKPNHTIKIPVEADLTDSFWDAYTADLAKEVALKVANKFNAPHEVAEYAVSVAKAVAEGLKRK